MLGISVYFKTMDLDYIRKAAELGVKGVFTSIRIPEEDLTDLDNQLPQLMNLCKELNLDVITDVSPSIFEKLKIESNSYSFLKDLGFSILRLDDNINDFEALKELSKDFKLILNASMIDREYMENALAHGVDFSRMSVMHNYYPRRETGIQAARFKEMNDMFRSYGLSVMAFVAGDKDLRFSYDEGLPTLEIHREMNPYSSTMDLMNNFSVDEVYVGDCQAEIRTLEYMERFMNEGIVTIPVVLEEKYQYMLEGTHAIRADISENALRITSYRGVPVKPSGIKPRYRGAITIDNDFSERYSGEFQICKKRLPLIKQSNVIGYVHPEYLEVLDFIQGKTVIKFVTI